MKNKVLQDTFKWLFIGLLLCFGVSYVTSSSEEIFMAVFGIFNGLGIFIYLIAELVLAIVLAVRITKMSPSTAKALYLVYAALTGLSLTGVFLAYTASSIALVFLATSIIFGVFAIIGKNSNIDLTKFGLYLFAALIAIIIVTIINIFIGSDSLTMLLCIVGILVFAGYTAYDVQYALQKTDMLGENAGIYCAFQLFLDFINLFIKLLRLFGKRND